MTGTPSCHKLPTFAGRKGAMKLIKLKANLFFHFLGFRNLSFSSKKCSLMLNVGPDVESGVFTYQAFTRRKDSSKNIRAAAK